MVVADKSMYNAYESDLEHYILTLMSGANRLLRHPSLGLVISVIVTKVRQIKKKVNKCIKEHFNLFHFTSDRLN